LLDNWIFIFFIYYYYELCKAHFGKTNLILMENLKSKTSKTRDEIPEKFNSIEASADF